MELQKIAATIEDSLQAVADIIPGHIAGLAVLPDLITRLETAVAAIEHLVQTIDPTLLHPAVAHVPMPVVEPAAVPRPVVSELAAPLPEPAAAVQPASTPAQTAATVTPTAAAAAGVPDELSRPA